MRRTGKPGLVIATVAAVAALGLSAPGAGASAPAKTSTKCPLSALAKAKKPVEITLWHSMGRANLDSLTKLTNQFNSSQSDVRVNLVNQTSYRETFDKFRAGLTSGDLPDVAQLEDTALQQAIDTKAVLPVQTCVDADHYNLSDFVPRVVDYYRVKGSLWPMPFNVSNPVFYYDKALFRKAGLDPDKPPTTLAEVKADAQKLKASGAVTKAGYGLKLDPWFLEQWLAKAGEPYVNNANGRKSRATKVVFDTKAGREVFSWLSDMVHSGLAATNNNEGPTAFDNLLGIGPHNYGMTIDTSAALGTATQVLGSGQYSDVEVGVAPMPGPVGKGGILVGGAALYISAKSSPEKQAAAWQYIKFLDDPQTQATWSADTGYVPLRKSATGLPAIQQRWAEQPGYKIAYDQLITGVNNTATAGPVIGDYQGVRDVVHDAEVSMFTGGTKPETALKNAASKSNAAMSDYNARIG